MQPAPIAARTDRSNPSDSPSATSSIGLYNLKMDTRSNHGFQLESRKTGIIETT